MTARTVLPAICVSLALATGFSQTPEPARPIPATGDPKPAPATDDKKPAAGEKKTAAEEKPETPPDVKAFQEAGKLTDPAQKIEAFEKFKTDFPESQMLGSADSNILETLVKKMPDQKERIRRFAATMYAHAKPDDKSSVADDIADDFLTANLLLTDAESYAKKSVASMRLAPYMQEQLKGYEKSKQTAPSPQDLEKRFLRSRASRVATLGQVELKLGHTAKGKQLLEESYAVNPNNGAVLSALGEMAARSGDDTKALEYLVPAKLSGHASPEAAQAFDAIFKKQHNGSTEGLESMLDAEYRRRYPNPIQVEPYKPSEKRSDRLVLAEVFTGSGCPPCAGADVAFDAAMERYSRRDLAVLMFHQHVPKPDPMSNPDSQARSKFYSVGGVPTYLIDGQKDMGGDSRDRAAWSYDKFNPKIEKDLESPAEAYITVGASLKGRTVHVNAGVTGVAPSKDADSKDLKVQIALVEKELRYNGENGIRFHPMVVRAIQGFDLAGERYDHSFDLDAVSKALKDHLDDYEAKGHRGESFQFAEKKYQIEPRDLAVVVFVQNTGTKHVLQAAYVDLSAEPARPTNEADRMK